jgi:hypothetical protein
MNTSVGALLVSGGRDRSNQDGTSRSGGLLLIKELARRGARQLLAQAMEAEVAEHVEKHRNLTNEGVCAWWRATDTHQNASWSRASGR